MAMGEKAPDLRDLNRVVIAAILLIIAAFTGEVAGFMANRRVGSLAGWLILAAVAAPIVVLPRDMVPGTLIFSSGLILAGLLAIFVRAKPVAKGTWGRQAVCLGMTAVVFLALAAALVERYQPRGISVSGMAGLVGAREGGLAKGEGLLVLCPPSWSRR